MIGVFPLNIVVLPGESVALHLFEPRYIELFQDHKKGEEFVILYSEKGKKSDAGTRVFIENIVNEYPDGTVDVIVKGKSVVCIESFVDFMPGKSYAGVEDKIVEMEAEASSRLIKIFNVYMSMNMKKVRQKRPSKLFYIANRLKLTQDVKNDLICLKSTKQLDNYLINQIKFLIKLREQEVSLNNNYYLN